MLDPKTDQVDYGELIMPPPGFTLKRAIGTTYSLDLQALLAIPVAMFYGKPISTEQNKSRYDLDIFDSVSGAASLITIFCQKGKIKVPNKFNKLLSFTEDCIIQIKPSGAFSSFHPKIWCLWFQKEDSSEKIVRFAVLSRNLTFDRSWDISFCFDGYVVPEKQIKNKPIIDFLSYLEKESGMKIDIKLKRDLERTEFKSALPIKSWTFHPIGISDAYVNPLSGNYFQSDTLLIMSPFVDNDSVIKTSNLAAGKRWLFSRKNELQKLSPESHSALTKSFCIPDSIVNGEWSENIDEINPEFEPEPLDLHAKLYIGSKAGHFTWLIGSANLTKPAFNRNIECLFEIRTDDYHYSPSSVFGELVTDEYENKLFEEFSIGSSEQKTIDETLSQFLRKLEFEIINCPFSGKIIQDETDKYFRYEMYFDATGLRAPDNFTVYIQIINVPLSSGFGLVIKPNSVNILPYSDRLKESQLSRYFVVSITHKGTPERSFIIKAEIDLPETRYGRIISEIIDSQEKFMQYLRLLLSENGIVDTETEVKNTVRSNYSSGYEVPIWERYNFPLFEELLKTTARHPDKLKRIDETIKKLSADKESGTILTPEFIELWEVFNQYLGK